MDVVAFLFLSVTVLVGLPRQGPKSCVPIHETVDPSGHVASRLADVVVHVRDRLIFRAHVPPAGTVPMLAVVGIVIHFRAKLFYGGRVNAPRFASHRREDVVIRECFDVYVLLVVRELLHVCVVVHSPSRFTLLVVKRLVVRRAVCCA